MDWGMAASRLVLANVHDGSSEIKGLNVFMIPCM